MIELGTTLYIAYTSNGKAYIIHIKLCTTATLPASGTGKGEQLGITMIQLGTTWCITYTSNGKGTTSYVA